MFIHKHLDCSSQVCRDKPGKGLLKETASESWKRTRWVFKAIPINQFLSWTLPSFSNVKVNHSAFWVIFVQLGQQDGVFSIAAAFQGGLLAPAHKTSSVHLICSHIGTHTYRYISAYMFIGFWRLLDKDIYWKNECLSHFQTTVVKILQMKQWALVWSLITDVTIEM